LVIRRPFAKSGSNRGVSTRDRGVLRAHGPTVPAAPPMRLPIPNPNPNLTLNSPLTLGNPIFNPNPNPKIKRK